MPIVQEIRNEVRKLNTKNIIWEKITHLEKEMRMAAAMERLIAPMVDKVSEENRMRKDRKVQIEIDCNLISSFFSLLATDTNDHGNRQSITNQLFELHSKCCQ